MHSEMGRLRKLLAAFFLVCFALGLVGQAAALGLVGQAAAQGDHALVAEVDGAINPVSQRFISRVIEQGHEEGAEIVVITLDTPGGLLDSTREIVQELLNSPVPVAVYVWPSGAQAASAGTFVTAAAHFAVMAPGTNIGAASPVGAGGEDIPDTLESKVVEDTSALMRSIASERDRNAEALEDTIVNATAYDAKEAVQLNVVDFIATGVDHLLEQVDGLTVETSEGPRTLETKGLHQRNVKMNLIERFLDFLADPNVSFILLSLGGMGLVIELLNPGGIVPGLVGVVFLILAFVSFGNLPVNWAGVGLIILAMGLLVAELLVAGFGVFGVGSLICFILGGLLLFDNFGAPDPGGVDISVNLWLLGSLAGAFGLGGLWILRTMVNSRRAERHDRPSKPQLMGAVGEVVHELAPRGTVLIADEIWTAISEDGTVISVGEKVVVRGLEGVVLTVVRSQRGED